MIAVVCDACGRSFRARPELAGRRGRCPGCGEPIVVPDEEDDAPAPAPRVRRAAARGGRRIRHGGTPKWFAPVAIGVVLVIVASFVVPMFRADPPWETALARGIDARRGGRYEEAIEILRTVPEGHRTWEQARANITELEDIIAADERRVAERFAQQDYDRVMAIKTGHVDATSADHEYHRGYVRYMLRRAEEFLADHPDDARAGEVRELIATYEPQAEPDETETADDVRAEINLRTAVRDFASALDAVDRFEAADPAANEEAAAVLRIELEEQAGQYWRDFEERMRKDGLLTPGAENWQSVVDRITNRFLRQVEGLPRAEARAKELLAQAKKGG